MFDFSSLAWIHTSGFGVSDTVALAAVAVLGYLFGHRTRQSDLTPDGLSGRRDLKRAAGIARQLEKIASMIRKDLAAHRENVSQFKSKLTELSANAESDDAVVLSEEAERILAPTLKLATQLSHAYDQIRQQSTQLLAFTEVRTDPITGITNRRAFDEHLETMFAMLNRYDRTFSIAIFDIDQFKAIYEDEGRRRADEALKRVARLMNNCVRETDIVARYGGEEFVVLMPYTNAAGAMVFAKRLRSIVERELTWTLCGGVAEAAHGDTSQTLLSRADSALYSAKANGRNCVFHHNGAVIRPSVTDSQPAAKPPAAPEDEPADEAAHNESNRPETTCH